MPKQPAGEPGQQQAQQQGQQQAQQQKTPMQNGHTPGQSEGACRQLTEHPQLWLRCPHARPDPERLSTVHCDSPVHQLLWV